MHVWHVGILLLFVCLFCFDYVFCFLFLVFCFCFFFFFACFCTVLILFWSSFDLWYFPLPYRSVLVLKDRGEAVWSTTFWLGGLEWGWGYGGGIFVILWGWSPFRAFHSGRPCLSGRVEPPTLKNRPHVLSV